MVAPRLWDAAGVLLVLAATWQALDGQVAEQPRVWALAIGVLPAPLVPLRRRMPLLLLAVAVISALGFEALVGATGGPSYAVLFGVHGMVVAYGRRLGIACALGVAALLVAWPGLTAGTVSLADLLSPVLTLGLAVAWGDATRSRRRYIDALEQRARDVEALLEAEGARRVAEDRLLLARDLHDSVGHQVAVISLNAGVAKLSLAERPDAAAEALEVIVAASQRVVAEINQLLTTLRTPAGSALGVSPTHGLADLDDLVTGFADLGLTVTMNLGRPLPIVTPEVDAVAYRVVQEALNNAHKHGSDARAELHIKGDPGLSILVANAAVGAGQASRGLGLVGMRERVAAVGGSLEVLSEQPTFILSVRLPELEKETS